MIDKIKKNLSISRREIRGLVVFFGLIIAGVYAFPYIYEKLFYTPLEIKVETLKPIIDDIELHSKNNTSNFNFEEKNDYPKHVTLFKFNPNNLPVEDWVKLGLSEKQASTIKKYEAKGGKFYKKEDVKKIYSISAKQYALLEPYIDIPQHSKYSNSEVKEFKRPEYKKVIVNINQADSLALLDVKGIGPAFAARIIKYRNRLGGFVNKEQLKEVYGVDSLKFSQLEGQLEIDLENIRYININQVTFEELKVFPYLTYKQMNVLLAYRKQHGPFKSVSDLSKIVAFNQNLINKIAPYLKFND